MKKKLVFAMIMMSMLLCGCGKTEVDSTESRGGHDYISSESTESSESQSTKLSSGKREGNSLEPSESSEEAIVSFPEDLEAGTSDSEKGSESSSVAESGEPVQSSSETVKSIKASSEPVESEEPIIHGAERREELKNTYTDIDLSVVAVDDVVFEECSWFTVPADASEYDYTTYQSIISAIDIYYGGNVPDEYTCDITKDIVTRETNMVFSVKVTGKSSTLLVGLNGYEFGASVEVLN